MKCLVGIDLEHRSSSAIALLGRLNFEVLETTLLHATEPLQVALPYSAYGMFVETDEILEALQESGKEALIDAKQMALEMHLNPTTQLSEGFPIRTLCDVADQSHTDLIAITSTVRNSIGAIFGGSVARGLAIGAKQSILIARKDLPVEGPIRAVFATDQSPYCNACVRLLAEMAPQGIAHLTLLTVYEKAKHQSLLAMSQGIDAETTVDETAKRLCETGQETAKFLTTKGIPTASKVIPGHIEETIHQVMAETGADLLIVGSQGHGFLDRMVVGSTCLHEVINERYPVLLLRPTIDGA